MIKRTSYSVIAKLRSAKFFLYKHRIYSTYSQVTPPITKPMDLHTICDHYHPHYIPEIMITENYESSRLGYLVVVQMSQSSSFSVVVVYQPHKLY